MLLAQAGKHRRQVIDQRRGAGADTHLAEPAVAVAAHGRQQALTLPGEALGVLDQLAARSRREGALAHAIDQAHAEPQLELADLQADRRLRKIEPLGRAGKTALGHDLGKRT
jgi:hypothetical protein